LFVLIYGVKETFRNTVKLVALAATGHKLR